MTEIPEKISISYIEGLKPVTQAASEVARTLNKIIDYLNERGPALDAFAKPMDELAERKLGPHPNIDPDLHRGS